MTKNGYIYYIKPNYMSKQMYIGSCVVPSRMTMKELLELAHLTKAFIRPMPTKEFNEIDIIIQVIGSEKEVESFSEHIGQIMIVSMYNP